MKKTVRVFVAIEASPSIRANCTKLTRRFERSEANAKWVEPENLHITLKFLGEVGLNETPVICEAVREAVGGMESFWLDIVGAGAFPNSENPKTVWIGTGEGENQLAELFERIEDKLAEKLRFRKEGRRFHGHLTLGRVRPGIGLDLLSEMLDTAENFEAGRMAVDEVVVFSSMLEKTGPIYESLGRVSLE
jgi:RNA 2',3'-cyclic 3'-phosphodiesterase